MYAIIVIVALLIIALQIFFIKFSGIDRGDNEGRLRRTVKPLIYIYDWPDHITHRWPLNYTHHRLSIDKKFSENEGFGYIVDAAGGIFHTHQYTLYTIFYHRLLASHHRTRDPAKAQFFFIPYDIGMDATTRQSDGALTVTNCPESTSVLKLLRDSPYFHRHKGADHFMIHSINQMMLFFNNKICSKVFKLCLNCIKFGIDSHDKSVFPELASLPHLTINWFSIPFPSNYHRGPGTRLPWNDAINTLRANKERYFAERRYAVTYMGSLQVTAKRMKVLRADIMQACQLFPSDCLAVHIESHSSNADYLASYQQPMFPYSASKLCLVPGGDFPTRKAFADAMLSGCVPVTFQLFAAQTQWLLHWGSAEKAMDCTFYVPLAQAEANMTAVLQDLIRIASDTNMLQKKLECISAVGNRFQYSVRDGYGVDAFEVALGILSSHDP
ncbi:hypothetical protein EON65_03985 [archaeon]|nr:MAG: hypothetical protein EON65_03985 [archaeon]